MGDPNSTEREPEGALGSPLQGEALVAAMRASMDGMAILDSQGALVLLNEAHARVHGYKSVAELVGRTWRSLYSGQELERFEREVMPYLRIAGRWRGEAVGTRRDGTSFPQEVSLTSLDDGGVACVVRDVSERHRSADTLHQLIRFNDEIISSAGVGIVVFDPSLRYLVWNPFMEALTGLLAGQVLGRHVLELFPQVRETGVHELLLQALAGATISSADIPFHVPVTGKRGWVSDTYTPHQNARGEIIGVVGAVRDITERKTAEHALRESEERYRRLVELSPDAIAVHSDGRLVFLNSAGRRLLGAPAAGDTLIGRPTLELVHPDYRPLVQERMRQATAGHETPLVEEKFLRLDGSSVDVEVAAMPFSHSGQPAVQVVVRDISDRKRAQRLQDALFRISEATATFVDMDAFHAALHGIVGQLMYARNFYIALYDEANDVVSFPYYADEVDEAPASTKAGRGLTEYVFRTGLPLLASPAVFEELVARGEVELVGAPSLDWLGVPLKRGERTFGALVVQSYTEAIRFSDGDRDLLTFVAQHIATAMDRKHAADALRASESNFRALAETAPCAILIEQRHRILYANPAMAEISGYQRHELTGLDLRELVHPVARQQVPGPEAAPAVGPPMRRELRLVKKGGGEGWVECTWASIEYGGRPALLLTAFDITERKRSEERIRNLAYQDALTGLPNRLLFNDRLSMAVAHAHRSRQRLAVLFLDLDRFKVINDSLGHGVGDRLLQGVAGRLLSSLREGDTVARLGGDEFTLLLPAVHRAVDVAKVAEKLLEGLREPFPLEGQELFVTGSVGIALYPDDGLDPEALVKNADTAMYRAKDQGRDTYQLYTPAMNATALERLAIENSLRRALAQDELEIHYQPMLELASGHVHGVEALLRWRHPERGLIPPTEFIPLAELTGLIVPIGPWVLRTACAQVRRWQEAGHPQLCLAVNISARQFQQAELVAEVRHALELTAMPAHSLDLEITESNAMQDPEAATRTLRELKALGVRISIDDFGIGHSSLSYLKRLPIDTLKIDRSFIRDIVTDPDDAAIVTAVLAMAETLKLQVVAEGVESEEQLAFLRDRRCGRIQGHLFSPPLPAADCTALLARHRRR